MISFTSNNNALGSANAPTTSPPLLGAPTIVALSDTNTAKRNNLSELSDTELVSRCKTELPEILDSYEELVARHRPLVYNYCVKLIGNRYDAEEVCQDAFLRVFHKIHQFEGRSSFKTWLFRIVSNMGLNRRGSMARNRDRVSLFAEEVSTQEKAELDDAGTDELAETIRQAMARLDDEKREIITLKFISGYSIEEISKQLNLKLSATKMRLYRARDELKSAYLTLSQSSVAN